MTGMFKKAAVGVALAASTLTAVAPAEAQYYRGYRHNRGGNEAGAAILGGIIGLGVGAAIASNNNRDRYYDDGYYYERRPRVIVRERYYAPPPRVIYRERHYRGYPRGYYGGGYGGGYYRGGNGYYGY